MPSHVHLLVGCKQGGVQLSKFMQAFKSLSSRRLFPGRGTVWAARFDDRLMKEENQFLSRLNYVHQNPVRSGLVRKPEEWSWSSARFWMSDDPHSVLTKGWAWME
jgi:REP element-mobilizing transposase RayT